jgi:hypothetical protein
VNRTQNAKANGAAAKKPWFQNPRDPPLAFSDLLDAYCCLGVVALICFLARIELSTSPLSTLRL